VSQPINFMGRKYAEAKLTIVAPTENAAVIKLHFNPSEYKLKNENTFAEIPIPGLASPPLQYVRGVARVLSMDLLADTSDTLENVRTKKVEPIQGLLAQTVKLHAPPIVRFDWDAQIFTGVVTSLEVTYVLFHFNGTPLRAKLALAMKEYRPVKVQLREKKKQSSPDVEKRYVVRAGETLSSISAAVFRDPAHWREIAVANDITDPRSVAPGTVLTVPRLEARRA
jgi:nucleoid-associated protein YgaU